MFETAARASVSVSHRPRRPWIEHESSASVRRVPPNMDAEWTLSGAYNALAIPVAAGILAPWGFILPMSIGALVMSVSTIVVALNAQLLRRLDLRQRDIRVYATVGIASPPARLARPQ